MKNGIILLPIRQRAYLNLKMSFMSNDILVAKMKNSQCLKYTNKHFFQYNETKTANT